MAKILLVEDDPFLSEMYLAKFLSLGYNIDVAHDGVEALKKIRRIKPQLILLDICLPLKSGFEVLEEIKSRKDTKNISVVLLTNLGREEDRIKAMKLGAVDYLIKAQFTPQEVVDRVKKIIS